MGQNKQWDTFVFVVTALLILIMGSSCIMEVLYDIETSRFGKIYNLETGCPKNKDDCEFAEKLICRRSTTNCFMMSFLIFFVVIAAMGAISVAINVSYRSGQKIARRRRRR